jgi:hypothetical protein
MGAYVAGGVGGAGLLTFGVFATLGKLADDAGVEECGQDDSNCTEERKQELVESADSKYLIGNVGLGVGIAYR